MKTVIPHAELERRRAVRLAKASDAWHEVVASFALSGIELTEANEELAGRMLSGELSYDQVLLLIREKYGGGKGGAS